MRIQVCPIRWTSFNSKENSGNKSFSCKTKASKPCIPMRRMCLLCSITIRMEIIMRIQIWPIWGMKFNSKENGGKKTFHAKPKQDNRVSQWKKLVCSAQSPKEWRLLRESKFSQFEGWTLILSKVVERKAFLAEPKHQNRVSQWKEHVLVPNHE